MHQPPPTPAKLDWVRFLRKCTKNLQRIKYSFTSMPTNYSDNKPITPLSSLPPTIITKWERNTLLRKDPQFIYLPIGIT